MRIIPVLDVMHGRVVRAVGGRRTAYRPVESGLTPSADPRDVARALLAAAGSAELYVADLDAIGGGDLPSEAVGTLVGGLRETVWLDPGVRRTSEVERLPNWPNMRLVVATETLWDPSVLRGVTCAALSVDLAGGAILGDRRRWGVEHPHDVAGLAAVAVGHGVTTLIVLDLTYVGGRAGPGTADVCRDLRRAFPKLTLFTGGGVRTWDDVQRLEDAGADGVLVASALHDGTLRFPRPAG